ncbi:MAG TPA: methyltransferase domain-containing protein [Polyangiaceae bacterium]|nr:methyltransferase domain-containing protein [Polyangiaceae bacterium]
MATPPALEARWQLYRLLGEPFRLRLLALAAEEELALGELAELLDESQPNVSRHAGPLRQAGLLAERRHGTRTFVRLSEGMERDAVVADALSLGRALCEDEGRLARIPELVRRRDARTREFFARPAAPNEPTALAAELPAYLQALRELVPARELAVDAGTGEGVLLDALAPIFRRVIAVDRSDAQLERAAERVALRGYGNVTLLAGELGDEAIRRAVGAGADLVMASRVLHHAPRPRAALEALVRLLKPGGRLVVVDYQRHADEAFRERQADVWNGFEPDELEAHARAAGLSEVQARPLPQSFVQNQSDEHIAWQTLVGIRPLGAGAEPRRD